MQKIITIESVKVGYRYPCYIVAEAGVNHNGDMDIAFKLIEEAVKAGVDAIKFQLFNTDELVIPTAPKTTYMNQTTDLTESQFKMLKSLELTSSQHKELKNYCERLKITYLCTPYDYQSADELEDMNVAAYKIASTDTTNTPFLRHIAKKGRPIILSTGMSTLSEIENAISSIESASENSSELILLHCTSEYPAPFDEVNLKAIESLSYAFRLPVGFSDHTPGIGASPWAVALGSCMIEKHFTLDRGMKGPDHRASLEPQELKELVTTIRTVEAALGDGIKRPMPSEIGNKSRLQKSLVARKDIQAGDVISEENLSAKRPGTGISPSMMNDVLGRKARMNIPKNEPITFSNIDWEVEPA